MAIFEITDTEVIQQCAKCGAENRIALTALEAGSAASGMENTDIIELPVCPHCRSAEALFRSPDDEPEYPSPGTFGHLHRMLVDHLHAELVNAHRVHPAFRDPDGRPRRNIARPLSRELRERWFPRGMKIERTRREPTEPRR